MEKTAIKGSAPKSGSKSTASKSSAAKPNATKSTGATTSKAASNGSSTNGAAKKVTAKKDASEVLKEFFEDGLKDIYWAEKALLKSLPKMQKNATNAELKSAIGKHLDETKSHVQHVEACFAAIGKKPKAQKCDAMEGLLKEGDSILEETEPGAMRDVGIIAAAQKVEHYEIASYGTLAAYAKIMKETECLNHLLQVLEQEKKTDELLTSLADTNLNSLAL